MDFTKISLNFSQIITHIMINHWPSLELDICYYNRYDAVTSLILFVRSTIRIMVVCSSFMTSGFQIAASYLVAMSALLSSLCPQRTQQKYAHTTCSLTWMRLLHWYSYMYAIIPCTKNHTQRVMQETAITKSKTLALDQSVCLLDVNNFLVLHLNVHQLCTFSCIPVLYIYD